ncbi:hypothetical protein MIMGU_mgv1a017371mg [Erythranthe guttata]|uniref:Uncharacterized protein n=1 Tax=Erythranthe guttata TaxID=4155 RepID=A0A022R6A1_ERYGU|nr:hypothetical protein MIMGU_mgv1a017371mg [Erythranthe guttata]
MNFTTSLGLCAGFTTTPIFSLACSTTTTPFSSNSRFGEYEEADDLTGLSAVLGNLEREEKVDGERKIGFFEGWGFVPTA